MASSVARMPLVPTDDVFGPHIRLKKVLLRDPHCNGLLGQDPDASASASASTSTSDAQPETPASAMRRRAHSQILDSWAARQAREMVTTIERQAHRVELPDLSTTTTTTQPGSVRAATSLTSLRESSPAASESSSSVGSNSMTSSIAPAASAASATSDLPQNVRASSLIQMWRELEAEAGVVRTPRTLSGGTSLTNASEDSEASGDSEPEVVMNAASSSSPSMTNNEKGRVGSIVRMISFKDRTTRDAVNSGSGGRETNEPALVREQPVAASADRQEGFALPSGGLVRLRSRRDIDDMMERMRKERQRNMEALGERRVVSQFPHRGRIQSVLKLRFLRRESAVQDQPRPTSKKRGTDRSQSGSSILLLREIFDNATQHSSGNEAQIAESSRNGSVQFPSTSQASVPSASRDLSVTDNRYQEVVSVGDQESSQPEMDSAARSTSEEVLERNPPRSRTEDRIELNSPNTRAEDVAEASSLNSRNEGVLRELNSPRCRSEEEAAELNSPGSTSEGTPELNSPRNYTSEDLQEIQNPDASWDERSLWVSNVDWRTSIESSPSQGWQGEVEPYTRQHVADIGHIWIGSCSPSWRGWGLEGQDYQDFLENFSDNTEIRELLERRRVSTSLASDFCGKMNRMILTFLNRQDHVQDENYSYEYEEQPIWTQNYELNNADQVASESSLLPSSYQSVHYPESWQYTSFTHNLSLDSREQENVNDLKNEVAQMRQEISQLRKLVESCMERQTKLQHSIKEEVSHVVRQSVTVANTQDFSRWAPSRKETCCICYKAQIDSLLYRCGHMCTCFKCAQELQWSRGRCPICRTSIADVVHAYPDSRGG